MKYIIFSFLVILFIHINYKIIKSDQKIKKIPNKYLIWLLFILPFWYIFIYFFDFYQINIFGFLLQISISFLISFFLFNFGIWKAGDAKYLLVLNFFIPHIGIISFIGNIGIFTLLYLFLYFLWFFLGRSILYKGYAKSLLLSIKIDLQEKWKVYKDNKGGKSFGIIIKWIIVFLIIFVSLRLFRIYIFLELFNNIGGNGNLVDFIQKYHFYIIFASIGITILIFYFGKKFINYYKKIFALKFNINLEIITYIFTGILFIFLIGFIGFEYIKNPDEIINYLIKIFTIYILIYIFAKIIFYSYKISFLSAEEKLINIKDLKVGDSIDKKYLLNLAKYLDYHYIKNKGIEIPENYILFFKRDEFIKKINELNLGKKEEDIIFIKENLNNIKKIILLYKEKKDLYPIENIKVLKTFPFSIYIFLGFIITIIFENSIINYIIKIFLIYFLNK